jgi:hypothetical protein
MTKRGDKEKPRCSGDAGRGERTHGGVCHWAGWTFAGSSLLGSAATRRMDTKTDV